jgi:hypothetical protein
VQEQPAAIAPTRRTSGRTTRDMAISLLVLLIPLALVVAVFRLRGGEDVVVVDPSPAIAQARAANAFPVTAPSGLPGQWRPVSAAFRPGSGGSVLRIGYLTPTGGAVQLIESDEPTEDLLPRELGDQIRPIGPVAVEGQQWRSFEVRGGETALVLAGSDRTLIVVGRAEVAELTQLAAAVAGAD